MQTAIPLWDARGRLLLNQTALQAVRLISHRREIAPVHAGEFFSRGALFFFFFFDVETGKVCAVPAKKGPPPKSLATSVTSEILVAYIILDIDGEVDGQRILPLAQGGTLLRQFAIILL